ncbi:MAG: hypothetical protein KA053_03295 [Lentimicrobiaceae bacterium]|nr:hypothetical protein [Lentimicrobiaceae bacterium]
MKNIVFPFLMMMALFAACEKGVDQKEVVYLVTDSDAGYSLTYVDEEGTKKKINVVTASKDDEWRYSFMGEPGSIVYISAVDTTQDSFVKLIIYVNGKVYKQGMRTEDVTKPVTVSGTIPF